MENPEGKRPLGRPTCRRVVTTQHWFWRCRIARCGLIHRLG